MHHFESFPARIRPGRSLVLAAALAVLFVGPILAAPEDHRPTSPTGTAAVFAAGQATGVSGAWSMVARDPSGLTMVVHTVGLNPGHAYAAWWVIFNAPEFCIQPNAAVGVRCGSGDLPANEGDLRVQASMTYATGHVVSGSEGVLATDFAAWLPVGTTGGAAFGPGLLDPAGAEIHLILTDLGSFDTVLDAYQLRALADQCAVDAAGCLIAQVSYQLP
jgi:hypothetical protein